MKKLYLAVCLLTLIGFACTKNIEPLQNVPIKQENISGSYLLVGFTSQTSSYPEVDLLGTLQACQQDNKFVLRKDGNFSIVDAGIQCTTSTITEGSWRLMNESTLQVQGAFYTIKAYQGKILTLSTTVLQNGEQVIITKRLMRH